MEGGRSAIRCIGREKGLGQGDNTGSTTTGGGIAGLAADVGLDTEDANTVGSGQLSTECLGEGLGGCRGVVEDEVAALGSEVAGNGLTDAWGC